jgi:LDH2 family malate/lactate/ureidoglycolate dehydrogenase
MSIPHLLVHDKAERVANIIVAIEQTDGARLPGGSRLTHRKKATDDGLLISPALHEEITTIINSGSQNA